MGKNGTLICKNCGTSYSKKLLFCPSCASINERRASQIVSLELKAYYNPDIGIRCKKCSTIYPDDQTKCLYCGASKEQFGKPFSAYNSTVTIETPMTQYYKRGGYVIKAGNRKEQTKTSQKKSVEQKLASCPACSAQISTHAESCPHCGHKTGVHVCPNCGSVNTRTISELSKATSIFLWGPFAANKVKSTYECKDCGQKF